MLNLVPIREVQMGGGQSIRYVLGAADRTCSISGYPTGSNGLGAVTAHLVSDGQHYSCASKTALTGTKATCPS